jgi:hypothetical protein
MSTAFMERIIALLMPHFMATAQNQADARSEIIETIAGYATRTRTELLHAAHAIAFGIATLDTLAESTDATLPPPMRLRHRNCANSLGRAMQRSENTLARCLAQDAPKADHAPKPRSSNDRNQGLWAGAMVEALQQLGFTVQPAATRTA